jgi:release factor glutamine methyltransferase
VAGGAAALAPGGLLLMEHHFDQSHAVIDLLNAAGYAEVRSHGDLEGVERFASARLPGSGGDCHDY